MGSRYAGTSRSTRAAVPSSPHRVARRARPAALLAALVVGAVAAGLMGVQGVPIATAEEPASVADLLGTDAEALAAEDADLAPMVAITEVEAQARLDEVAATRAARAEQAAAAEAAAIAAAEAARPDGVMPVDGARLTSCFCPRWGTMHWGIDLAAPMMTEEYAAADGVVLRAGAASGYGNAVYILHDSGDVTVYGHMEKILVDAGDVVSAGETIALLGSRGQSTGPHLHFGVHRGGLDGKRVDPVEWLEDLGVEV
jgi:murein DD-endopeptidase MepM/ murein hydrolase activator NlpD